MRDGRWIEMSLKFSQIIQYISVYIYIYIYLNGCISVEILLQITGIIQLGLFKLELPGKG